MNSDGTGASDPPLTNNLVGDLTPTWMPSPDEDPNNDKIVFHRAVLGRPQLFVMNADGTDQTPLTNTPGINLFAELG